MESAIVVSELAPGNSILAAGMETDCLAWPSNGSEIFVDETGAVQPVEIALVGSSNVEHLIDP